MLTYNRKLKKFSQQLRNNMTDAEKLLWSRLRRKQLRGLQFYRQKIIGNYIVDFYCPQAKLVIELDGGGHYTYEGKELDHKRDSLLKKEGLTVLRFSDRELFKNIEGVLQRIYQNLP
jgi:very-short-patch-repair endonuclease